MHILNSRPAPSRLAMLALVIGALSAVTVPARAADDFAVTGAQIQALGVTLQRLERPADIEGQVYPARVVLPPAREQVVSAPLAGLVDKVLVGENDVVTIGQPLLRLISPELGELQFALIEAASRSRLSQKTLQRERALFAEGIIPERRVQEAEGAAEADGARRQHTEAALRLAGLDANSVRRIVAGGALQNGVTVFAQAPGTVMSLSARTGQRVAQADALMHLADTRELWLDVQIPADRRNQVQTRGGQIAVVGRDAVATPTSVGAMVSDTQTVVLRARVTRGAADLRAGEYVQVKVPFAGTDAVAGSRGWAVPARSIVRQGDRAYLFVRTDKGFVARPVTVSNSAGTSAQVQGDLKPGQEIAVTSVIALKAAWLGKSGSS